MEKIIHQIWFHGEIPAKYQSWMNKWKELHPGWSYRLWSLENIPTLTNQFLYENAKDFVRKDCTKQFQADIVRYEILAEFGGFYCDCDTEPLKPIDDYVLGYDLWGAEYMSYVGNTYLGCTAKHPAMIEIVNNLEDFVKMHRKPASVSTLSGMRYITPYWIKYDGYVAEEPMWYPYCHIDALNPTFTPIINDEVIAIHHWASQSNRGV